MPRIVVVEPIHEDGLALLRSRGDAEIIAFDAPASDEDLAQSLPSADAILVRTLPLPAEKLALAKGLKIVSKHGVGCDNIDVAHCTARGLPVAIAADANATSVAEHTLALMLACAKRLPEQDSGARNADWSYRQRVQAFELNGKTALIIGLGRIGARVARLCEAFGMTVIGYDPYAGGASDFDAALAAADVVSVHVPMTETSRNMLDAAALAKLKRGALLINCARGGIVDEPALIDALDSGQIAMYGTDVFETEPIVASDPLLSRKDVIATAHTGAMTAEARRNMAMQSAENVLAALDDTLNPTVLINRTELGL